MKITFDNNTIDITPSGKSYRATMGDKTVEVEILRAEDGLLELLIEGERVTAYVSSDNAKRWVTINGCTTLLTKSSGTKRSGAKHEHSGEMTAPMPGQVRTVNVSEGNAVTKGQTLIVLEAMKMEMKIQAPMDGTVRKVFVKKNETIEREQILIEIEES